MDPNANITEQREVAREIVREPQKATYREVRLAELVLALDEWRQKGGFDPYASGDIVLPTREQYRAIVRLSHRGRPEISERPFDLPKDYVMCVFPDGFTCGISPEGDVSS